MQVFICDRDDTLKEFTDRSYPQGSFVFNRLLKEKDIKVNGKKVAGNVHIRKGDTIQYYTTKAQEQKEFYQTIFEDENVLIIDKQDGVSAEAMFCHLQRKYSEFNSTYAEGINANGLYNFLVENQIYFIHRLDRNTKGLMVFAKSNSSEQELLRCFKQGLVKKVYNTIVVGKPKEKNKVLHDYLIKDEKNSRVAIYPTRKQGSVEIITEYDLMESNEQLSKLEVKLHTGKTHQIRAHLAYAGLPVLGDEKYGNEQINEQYNVKRQQLLAKSLTITDEHSLQKIAGKTFSSKQNLSLDQYKAKN